VWAVKSSARFGEEAMSDSKIVASRIGKLPVPMVDKVSVEIDGKHVKVKGPKGELARTFVGVSFEHADGVVVVHPEINTKKGKALHGLGRALLNNMVIGVSSGYKRELDLKGVGYRMDAKGQDLTFHVGFSHPVHMTLPKAVSAKVEGQTHLTLESIDKQIVGQVAAQIRAIRPPEPYKGKGIRYSDEVVRLKAGKSASK
jgi:large subunit ribosomal protein L6